MGEKGFTLIELVVAMAIAGIVMAGMVAAYRQQTRSAANLGLRVVAQQNLRAGLYHLERDLRMAGADLTGRAYNGTLAIRTAEAGRVTLSWDDNSDGAISADEVITYSLYASSGMKTRNLGRSEGGARNQPVAQNIEAMDIHYFGRNATVPMARPVTGARRGEIRRVQVTLVGRSPAPLKFTRLGPTRVFRNPQGEAILVPPQDPFQRILLGSEVTLRNMGGIENHGN